MRKTILPIAITILVSAASVAMASTTTGTVMKVDPAKKSVTLANGMSFTVPAKQISGMQKGEKVKIIYSKANGHMKASRVVPMG